MWCQLHTPPLSSFSNARLTIHVAVAPLVRKDAAPAAQRGFPSVLDLSLESTGSSAVPSSSSHAHLGSFKPSSVADEEEAVHGFML